MLGKLFFGAIALAGLGFAAHAQDYTVGVGVSTLGITVEPSYRLSDSVSLRAPLSYAAYNAEIDFEDTPGDGKIALGGAGLLADYMLGRTGLRVFGGVHATKVSMETSIRGNFTLDGEDYNGRASIEISPKRTINPMLGVGYTLGANKASGMRLSMDLGAILIGSMVGDIDAVAAGADFDQDLKAAEQELDKELAGADFYPFIKLTAEWRF